MVNFSCQFDWIKNQQWHLCGTSGGVSVRVFPERIDWVSGRGGLPDVVGTPFHRLGSRIN